MALLADPAVASKAIAANALKNIVALVKDGKDMYDAYKARDPYKYGFGLGDAYNLLLLDGTTYQELNGLDSLDISFKCLGDVVKLAKDAIRVIMDQKSGKIVDLVKALAGLLKDLAVATAQCLYVEPMENVDP